jgi:hypothetical protein
MRWAALWHAWERREKYTKILAGKPKGRPRRRGEAGITMDLTEIGNRGVYWIKLAKDMGRWWAVVNALMNLRVLAPRS